MKNRIALVLISSLILSSHTYAIGSNVTGSAMGCNVLNFTNSSTVWKVSNVNCVHGKVISKASDHVRMSTVSGGSYGPQCNITLRDATDSVQATIQVGQNFCYYKGGAISVKPLGYFIDKIDYTQKKGAFTGIVPGWGDPGKIVLNAIKMNHAAEQYDKWPENIDRYTYEHKVMYEGALYSCYADKKSPYAKYPPSIISSYCKQKGYKPGDPVTGRDVWYKQPELLAHYRLTYYDYGFEKGDNFFYAIPYLKSRKWNKEGKHDYKFFHMTWRPGTTQEKSYGGKTEISSLLKNYKITYTLWDNVNCAPYPMPSKCLPRTSLIGDGTKLQDVSFWQEDFYKPDCYRPLGVCLESPEGGFKDCVVPALSLPSNCRPKLPSDWQPDYLNQDDPIGWSYPDQP